MDAQEMHDDEMLRAARKGEQKLASRAEVEAFLRRNRKSSVEGSQSSEQERLDEMAKAAGPLSQAIAEHAVDMGF